MLDNAEMHQALKIDEIVRLICWNLMDEQCDDLLSIALTCKAFEQPGLDCLWNRPLMTRDIFWPFVAYGVLRSNGGLLDLIRIATSHELAKYALYAARVRVVHCSDGCLTLKACSSLFGGRRKEIHFPLIHRLVAPIGTAIQINIARLFLSRSLRSLELSNRGATPAAWHSLLEWCTAAPIPLEKVTLYLGGIYGADSASIVSSFLSSIPTLKSITLQATPLLLSQIALIPIHECIITDLSIITTDRWDDPSPPGKTYPIRVASLPSLHHLTLRASLSNIDMETLVQTVSVSYLRTLDLSLDPKDIAGGVIRIVLSNLAIQRPCGTLQRLSLAPMHITFRPTPPIKSPDLSPLSNSLFSVLEELVIIGLVSYDILDDDLRLIAKWCPRLTTFRLTSLYMTDFHPNPVITLEGLLKFVHELICLEHITVPVKASPMALEPSHNGQVTRLMSWNISYSKVTEPIKVAALLIRHLPMLQTVTVEAYERDKDYWGNLAFIQIWEEMHLETIQ